MAEQLKSFLGEKIHKLQADPSFSADRLGISVNSETGKIYKVTTQQWVSLLSSNNVAYKGAATATTDPGTPSSPVFYSASDEATYINFKDSTGTSLAVGQNEFAILSYDGTAWSKQVLSIDLSAYAKSTDITGAINEVSQVYVGKNLLDKSKIVGGSYYSYTSFSIGANSNYRRTGYIKVEEGKTYTISGVYQANPVGGYFENDGDVNAIDNIGISAGSFTVPSGQSISYVVFDIQNAGGGDTTYDNTAQLELGSTATTYETYAETRLIPSDKLAEQYAKESEIDGLVASAELFDVGSFNKINPSIVDFVHRYSTGSKAVISADSLLIAASGYMKVEEGEFYCVSGNGIYNLAGGLSNPQGGYFASSGDTSAVDNITFSAPVTGSGKIFQVPTGQGINYVIISLATNASHTALSGDAQMEHGEQATPYQPYELKSTIKTALLPDDNGGEQSNLAINDKAWFEYTNGERKNDILKAKAPNFWKHYLLKDKDLVVINTGTSLSARSSEHCTTRTDANERPPLMHSNNMPSILWDKLKWDNQYYRRYDYPNYFVELDEFNATTNLAEWDDNTYRAGYTRVGTNDSFTGNILQMDVPVNAYKYNLIYRTDSLGCTQVKVSIAEGDDKMEVLDESDGTWKEANAFVFSELESTPVARSIEVPNESTGTTDTLTISTKANTTYQKRLYFRCKSDNVNSLASSKTITLSKETTGRFMYWGVEWSLRPYMITYINAARGSHNSVAWNTRGLPRFADNEVWGFKPDLMFFELPIHNDGAAAPNGVSRQRLIDVTNNYVFNTDYELSMKTRSQALNGYVPELIMFSSTITWNFGGITDDGQLVVHINTDGEVVTALDFWNAVYNWVDVNHPEAGFINSVYRYVEACFAIFGDMKTATLGSGKNGSTFTNEGSHPNDTGSKVWAKTLTGCFEFV